MKQNNVFLNKIRFQIFSHLAVNLGFGPVLVILGPFWSFFGLLVIFGPFDCFCSFRLKNIYVTFFKIKKCIHGKNFCIHGIEKMHTWDFQGVLVSAHVLVSV